TSRPCGSRACPGTYLRPFPERHRCRRCRRATARHCYGATAATSRPEDQGAFAIRISKRRATVTGLGADASVTEMVMCAELFAVGVPEMTPVAGSKLSPGGS